MPMLASSPRLKQIMVEIIAEPGSYNIRERLSRETETNWIK